MRAVIRIIRAPFFLIGLALSFVGAAIILACVSVGTWCEDGLHLIGYRERPPWLPLMFGILMYVGLGIAAPIYLGSELIGWPGAILGPALTLTAIAILGRW